MRVCPSHPALNSHRILFSHELLERVILDLHTAHTSLWTIMSICVSRASQYIHWRHRSAFSRQYIHYTVHNVCDVLCPDKLTVRISACSVSRWLIYSHWNYSFIVSSTTTAVGSFRSTIISDGNRNIQLRCQLHRVPHQACRMHVVISTAASNESIMLSQSGLSAVGQRLTRCLPITVYICFHNTHTLLSIVNSSSFFL